MKNISQEVQNIENCLDYFKGNLKEIHLINCKYKNNVLNRLLCLAPWNIWNSSTWFKEIKAKNIDKRDLVSLHMRLNTALKLWYKQQYFENMCDKILHGLQKVCHLCIQIWYSKTYFRILTIFCNQPIILIVT